MRKLKANEIETITPAGIITLNGVIERFTVINKILCDYIASGVLDYYVDEEKIKDIIEGNNLAIIALKMQKREILRVASERKSK